MKRSEPNILKLHQKRIKIEKALPLYFEVSARNLWVSITPDLELIEESGRSKCVSVCET